MVYLFVEQQLDILGEADVCICRWRRDSLARWPAQEIYLNRLEILRVPLRVSSDILPQCSETGRVI